MVLRRVNAAAEAPTPDTQSTTTPPASSVPNRGSRLTMTKSSHRIPPEDLKRTRGQYSTRHQETSGQSQRWSYRWFPSLGLTDEELERLNIHDYEEDEYDTLFPWFALLVYVLGMVFCIAILYLGVQDAKSRNSTAQGFSHGLPEALQVSAPAPAPAPPAQAPALQESAPSGPATPATTSWPSKEEMDTIVDGIIKVMHAYHDISKSHSAPSQETETPLERALRKIREDWAERF